jgi:hypothetical protein
MGDAGFLLLILLHLYSRASSFSPDSLAASLPVSFVDADSSCSRRHRTPVYETPRPLANTDAVQSTANGSFFGGYMYLRGLLFQSLTQADAVLSDQKNNACMRPMFLLNLKAVTKQELCCQARLPLGRKYQNIRSRLDYTAQKVTSNHSFPVYLPLSAKI